MNPAGHKLFLIFTVCVASWGGIARGQQQPTSNPNSPTTTDVLAQGSGPRRSDQAPSDRDWGKLWTAQVMHNPQDNSEGAADVTIIRVKPLEPGGAWSELYRLAGGIIGIGHRRSQLAVLAQDKSVLFVWHDGQSMGPRLPGRGSQIIAICGDESPDGDALWAVGEVPGGMAALAATTTTQSATTPAARQVEAAITPATTQAVGPAELVLFTLVKDRWVPRAAIPANIAKPGTKLSLLVEGKLIFLTSQESDTRLTTGQWDAQQGTWTPMGAVSLGEQAKIGDFKLLVAPGPSDQVWPVLWVAGATEAGKLFTWDKGAWAGPFDLRPAGTDLSQVSKRDVTVANQRLRLVFEKGGKLFEQSYEDHLPLSSAAEIVAPAPSDSRPGWFQVLLMVVVMFVALGTIRGSRAGAELAVLEEEKLSLAPYGLRFAAGLIDLLPVVVTLFIVAWRANKSNDPPAAIKDPMTIIAMSIAFGVYLAHTLLVELFTSRTIGKMFFGLKVVGMDGKDASRAGLAVRNLLRVIDLSLVFFPLALVLFTPLRQRLGDAAAGTIVVTRSDARL